MTFRRKKTYEDIYKWHRHNNGTCFYCYEDKPVAVTFVGTKGICQECLDHFKAGHVGTDRHAIAHLTKSLPNHEATVEWLQKHGVKLAPTGYRNNAHCYMAINNLGTFNHYHEIIYGNIELSTVGSDTAKRIFDSYNDIEIYKDGSIRIIY